MSNKKIYPCKQIWRLMIPDGAVGADEVYFDFFNGASAESGTGPRIVISAVKVIVVGDVAVTSTLAVNLHLHKSTTVGTGGTAATEGGVANTAATFNTLTPNPGLLPNGITARLKPTGAATKGAWIGQVSAFTEETNAGTYVEKWLHHPDAEAIVLHSAEGLQVIQGVVASAGNVGFIIDFGIIPAQ